MVWHHCSSETAAFQLPCDITCCCYCNNLIIPPQCVAVHAVPDRWDGAWDGRAARWYGAPGPSLSWGCSGDGRPCEWLWLCGLPQGWWCTPSPPYCDECKINKSSLICADTGKTHWLPQQLLSFVLGEINLITGSVKRCDHSPSSNLHINVAWRVQPAMFMDGRGWGNCF